MHKSASEAFQPKPFMSESGHDPDHGDPDLRQQFYTVGQSTFYTSGKKTGVDVTITMSNVPYVKKCRFV
jgi:hypothetical protein